MLDNFPSNLHQMSELVSLNSQGVEDILVDALVDPQVLELGGESLQHWVRRRGTVVGQLQVGQHMKDLIVRESAALPQD